MNSIFHKPRTSFLVLDKQNYIVWLRRILAGLLMILVLAVWVWYVDIRTTTMVSVPKWVVKVQNQTKWLDIFWPERLKDDQDIFTMEAEIDKKQLASLFKQLPLPYSEELQQTNYMDATVKFKDQTYLAKIKIHGDLYSHWSNPKKSWRVKLSDGTIRGYGTLKFIIPEERQFFVEFLANYRAKKLGLPYLESWFGELIINGENQGVYIVQGDWGKTFLENNGFDSSSDIVGEKDPLTGNGWVNIYRDIGAWGKLYSNPENPKDLALLDELLRFTVQASDDEFGQKIDQVLNVDEFISWSVHQRLMNSYHQDSQHNNVFIVDSGQKKLIMVPYDADCLPFGVGFEDSYHPLLGRMMKIDKFRWKREALLNEYTSNLDNLKDDLAFYDRLTEEVGGRIMADKNKNYSNLFYWMFARQKRQDIIKQFMWLREGGG